MARNSFHSYDVLGNIAVVKFSRDIKEAAKKKFAKKIMSENKGIKTILEKTEKFKGRLRKMQTKYILGEKTKEALYKENNCVFRFNVDETYFSPRLSNERKEIAEKIKAGDVVLVMFAGVAPFPVVIAKNSKAKKVYSNEINREANRYAKMNIALNNLKNRIELVPGDIKNVAVKLSHHHNPDQLSTSLGLDYTASREVARPPLKRGDKNSSKLPNKFDVIVMPRPQLKDSFLKEAFSLSKTGKRGTRIYYYDFCKEDEKNLILEKIKKDAEKAKKKIKILGIKIAGEIGAYRARVRVDFMVM